MEVSAVHDEEMEDTDTDLDAELRGIETSDTERTISTEKAHESSHAIGAMENIHLSYFEIEDVEEDFAKEDPEITEKTAEADLAVMENTATGLEMMKKTAEADLEIMEKTAKTDIEAENAKEEENGNAVNVNGTQLKLLKKNLTVRAAQNLVNKFINENKEILFIHSVNI